MIVERDVIRFKGSAAREHRVVWADQRDVWLFELGNTRTSFSRWARSELEKKLLDRTALIVTGHAHDVVHVESALTEAQRNRRDRMLKIIAPLVARAPEIFNDRVRGRAVAEVERDGVSSAKTIHAALDGWWRGGMTSDAIVKRFNNGQKPTRRAGMRRSGRKQPEGTPQGVVITAQIEAIFEKAIKRYYANDRKNALSAAYRAMLGEHLVDELRDRITGDVVYLTKPEYAKSGFPTLRQFRYWYSKRPDLLGTRRKREGASNYDKDRRATTGSAREHLLGVGARFEIDATQLEIGTVSGINGNVYVDPPTFYQVVDVLTGLVCGIYVGYEEASWIGAGLAVRNVVEDKVEFAARFGVRIERRQWPCQGVLPKRLLADNAEFKGDLATAFTAKSHVTVENARALRGDDKGTVEGKFNLFKTELRKHLPGLRKRNQANPGDADYSRDACLTLKDVTAAVIETVVLLNNRLMNRHPTRSMMEAGVDPVPSEMWDWALRNGATELRRFDPAAAEFAMLPTETVSITADGIRFRKLFYAGANPQAAIFQRARQDGVRKVVISYDPLCTTSVYVHDPKATGGYRVFSLTGESTDFADVAFEDAAKMMAFLQKRKKQRQFEDAENEAAFARSQAAKERRAKATRKGRFSVADVKKGRQNKKAEREDERATRTSSMPKPMPAPSRDTVVYATDRFAPSAASEPKRDILGDDDFDAWLAGRDKE